MQPGGQSRDGRGRRPKREGGPEAQGPCQLSSLRCLPCTIYHSNGRGRPSKRSRLWLAAIETVLRIQTVCRKKWNRRRSPKKPQWSVSHAGLVFMTACSSCLQRHSQKRYFCNARRQWPQERASKLLAEEKRLEVLRAFCSHGGLLCRRRGLEVLFPTAGRRQAPSATVLWKRTLSASEGSGWSLATSSQACHAGSFFTA